MLSVEQVPSVLMIIVSPLSIQRPCFMSSIYWLSFDGRMRRFESIVPEKLKSNPVIKRCPFRERSFPVCLFDPLEKPVLGGEFVGGIERAACPILVQVENVSRRQQRPLSGLPRLLLLLSTHIDKIGHAKLNDHRQAVLSERRTHGTFR
jgi:hypothetical protein